MYFDKEKYEELSAEHGNVINQDKIYVLPQLIILHAVVEVFITQRYRVAIESQGPAIRHGRHLGSRVFLGLTGGLAHYSPKFIWNGKEWLLDTYGHFVFGEVEVNAVNYERG